MACHFFLHKLRAMTIFRRRSIFPPHAGIYIFIGSAIHLILR